MESVEHNTQNILTNLAELDKDVFFIQIMLYIIGTVVIAMLLSMMFDKRG